MEPNLRDVLPSAAAALGVPMLPGWRDFHNEWGIPATNKICVVMVDGMGFELLRDRSGHAPFMGREVRTGHRLGCGFPSTTATSLSSLATGLPPGAHGMLGYLVRDPASGRLLNELSWKSLPIPGTAEAKRPPTTWPDGPDPKQWQRQRNVFEQVASQGMSALQVGPKKFAASGMTLASFRGAQFVVAESLADRVQVSVDALQRLDQVLVYLYWGDLDKVGHQAGCGSFDWGDELTAIDSAMQTLTRQLPADAVLVVTADHGMVDIPDAHKIDVAHTPHLAKGVALVGGEPRAPMVYCHPGEGEATAQRWREFLGDRAVVATRQEAIDRGWYGKVEPWVVDRIGDVVANMVKDYSVHDSRTQGESWHTMIGMHGAQTVAETDIPVITIVGEQYSQKR